MGQQRKCKLEYCNKPIAVMRDELCGTHYAQIYRYGFDEPRPVKTYEKNKKCDAPWCERMVYQRSVCIPCYKRMKRYQVTLEEYVNLPTCCEVCGASENIHVDHDHDTGKWRGVLCAPCNHSFGFLQEDVQRILALAEYAKRVNNVAK